MSNSNTTESDISQQPAQQKQKPPVLEEDDEFEDFPVEGKKDPTSHELCLVATQPQPEECGRCKPFGFNRHLTSNTFYCLSDWPQEETEQGQGSTTTNGAKTHLWEESWDDDDENEDFSKQLKEEIKKVEGAK
ncbi:hypothetical protein BGW36DRAFT_430917 [Talaromyces proteolyticus]|uniref:26S proteasome complex subunit SEM1 n=1 Tax=Talaromyces proteolyticus TaxID=1131652 RepID=A0AAD4PVC9_9EURO|nr:uncharacterized protein BGW36DRAFT_430917 [Talaromyces proteolyticus]KAH8693179.1 hypothetical protein BGW36DRAFT_430917 [Talaromyces proteolyticus]